MAVVDVALNSQPNSRRFQSLSKAVYFAQKRSWRIATNQERPHGGVDWRIVLHPVVGPLWGYAVVAGTQINPYHLRL